MDDEVTSTTVSIADLSALQAQIEQLSDLFRRRLLEDRSKNALIESVQEQTRATTALLHHRDFETLFREALLAIDRLRSEPSTPELVDSVVEELLEVFRRRELVQVDDEGEFDPRIHEAIGTVPAVGALEPNVIAAVQRRGYLLNGRLLRPAQVTIAVSADE